MGYTTDFTGHVTVDPPLNPAEVAFLRAFAETRRQTVPEGPYSTKDYGWGQLPEGASDWPPEGQPSRWCDWEPTQDAAGIEWNGVEKFDAADIWMQYLIDHFLKPGAAAQGLPGFEEFTFDHTVNGVINAQGEREDDVWRLVVVANVVEKVEQETPFQRMTSLLAEYRDRRRDGDPIPVELTDEIVQLINTVRDEADR
jgi:hypothetical protein